MALFLVQHGQSASRDVDPDRGLTAEGRADVRRIAGVAHAYGIKVQCILHSGKLRARQTAEMLAESLAPPDGVHAKTGLDPLDDVTALAGLVASKADLMLVGHLPFMERLAAWLVTGSAETPIFRFQNGGIVCLRENPERDSWIIVWALMPRID